MNSHTAGKLEDLRELIEHGNYRVDPGAVAEAIIRRLADRNLADEPAGTVRGAACRPSPARIRAARPLGRIQRASEGLVAVGS